MPQTVIQSKVTDEEIERLFDKRAELGFPVYTAGKIAEILSNEMEDDSISSERIRQRLSKMEGIEGYKLGPRTVVWARAGDHRKLDDGGAFTFTKYRNPLTSFGLTAATAFLGILLLLSSMPTVLLSGIETGVVFFSLGAFLLFIGGANAYFSMRKYGREFWKPGELLEEARQVEKYMKSNK